ncbi:putative ribonuclease H-like domain-containing protein [Tanacetum coccineum]
MCTLRFLVKFIRTYVPVDNGTEFKNKVMDDFCREKGIKREYSVVRTPQQNGVAERRNRILIEAARTILGKFNGKSDEGFFVEYSLSSKAFRVHKVNLVQDVDNGEPKSIVDDQKQDGDGPDNENGEQDKFEDDSSLKEVNAIGQHVNTASPAINTGSFKLNVVGPSVNTTSSYNQERPKDMFTIEASHTLKATHVEFFSDEDKPEVDLGNITNSYTVPTTPNTRIHKDHPIENVIGDVKTFVQTRRMTKPTSEQGFLSDVYEQKTHDTLNTCLYACFLSQIEPTSIAKALSDSSWVEAMQEELLQFKLQQVWILMDLPIGKRVIRTKWVFRNKKDKGGIVIRNKARKRFRLLTTRYKIPENSKQSLLRWSRHFKWVASSTKSMLYNTRINVITGYEKLMKDKFQMSSMGELTFFLGLQAQQKEDGIFISQDKDVAEILKKFNYTDVKSASTPIDLEKPLVKDGDADDVDVHLYRSMIGSLMYLTASRPNIMFH